MARLDTMLGGGYYRGASVLITGFPGTAKSTLSGAFAEAACQRGERTLFVSFDSDANEVIRNLASVNIRLERFVKNGLLRTDVRPRHHRQRGDSPDADQESGARNTRRAAWSSIRCPRCPKAGNEGHRPQRGGTADRLGESGGHHAGLHQPAGRQRARRRWKARRCRSRPSRIPGFT